MTRTDNKLTDKRQKQQQWQTRADKPQQTRDKSRNRETDKSLLKHTADGTTKEIAIRRTSFSWQQHPTISRTRTAYAQKTAETRTADRDDNNNRTNNSN